MRIFGILHLMSMWELILHNRSTHSRILPCLLRRQSATADLLLSYSITLLDRPCLGSQTYSNRFHCYYYFLSIYSICMYMFKWWGYLEGWGTTSSANDSAGLLLFVSLRNSTGRRLVLYSVQQQFQERY